MVFEQYFCKLRNSHIIEDMARIIAIAAVPLSLIVHNGVTAYSGLWYNATPMPPL